MNLTKTLRSFPDGMAHTGIRRIRGAALSLIVALCSSVPLTAHTQGASLPTAAQALEAYRVYMADPVNGLSRTQPFLDFIRGSGEIHIVLNEALVTWMYEDYPPEIKAVLYAAFIGGNMAAQLEQHATGSDDEAAARSLLAAYAALKQSATPTTIPLLESLQQAAQAGRLAAAIADLEAVQKSP